MSYTPVIDRLTGKDFLRYAIGRALELNNTCPYRVPTVGELLAEKALTRRYPGKWLEKVSRSGTVHDAICYVAGVYAARYHGEPIDG